MVTNFNRARLKRGRHQVLPRSAMVATLAALIQVLIPTSPLTMPCCAKPDSIVRVEKTDKRQLEEFLRLRRSEDRNAAEFYFETHPSLRKNALAVSEFGLNMTALRYYDEGVRLTLEAAKISPGDDYLLASAAYALEKQKSAKAGLKYASAAVSLKPNARNLCILARLYESCGQKSRANTAINCAEKTNPEAFELAQVRTAIALHRLERDNVIQPLDAYIKKYPGDLRALLYRAESLCQLGEHKSAINDLTKILTLYPDHTTALQKRAEEYRHMRRLEPSVADMRSLLLLKNVGTRARLVTNSALADSLESMGDLKGALAARQALVACHCKLENLSLNNEARIRNASLGRDIIACARLENKLKQFSSALKSCDLVLSGLPNETAALEQRAIALEGMGRLRDAVKAYSLLVERHKHYPDWLEARARVYEKLGDKDSARSDRESLSLLKNEI